MRSLRLNIFSGLTFLMIALLAACSDDKKTETVKEPLIIKGLYSFGPEAALFFDCSTGKEYWTADSSAQLELQYSQLGFEKPYQSVYIEVEGEIKPSRKNSPEAAYDSTLTVKKLISIKKDIPAGYCK